MSARSPRRSFARPFVVTLAALPACVATTSTAPPPQHQPVVHGEPAPQPQPQPPAGTAQPPGPAPTVSVISNPPRPQPVAPTGSPVTTAGKAGGGAATPPTGTTAAPAQQPPAGTYSFDRRWTVTKSGDQCLAMANVECPKPVKGKPVMTCNPPPPIKYTCPANVDLSAPLTIVQRANQADCETEPAAVRCPPNTMCNPPPPRKVACPGSPATHK